MFGVHAGGKAVRIWRQGWGKEVGFGTIWLDMETGQGWGRGEGAGVGDRVVWEVKPI